MIFQTNPLILDKELFGTEGFLFVKKLDYLEENYCKVLNIEIIADDQVVILCQNTINNLLDLVSKDDVITLKRDNLTYNFKFESCNVVNNKIKFTLKKDYELPFCCLLSLDCDLLLNMKLTPINIKYSNNLFMSGVNYNLSSFKKKNNQGYDFIFNYDNKINILKLDKNFI